jgi:hypothetical protein
MVVPNSRFQAAQPYTLVYKMDEGTTTFTVEMARKHRNQRNIMGNDLITNSKDLTVYGFAVNSSGENGLKLELEYVERTHETDDSQILTGPDFSNLIGKKVKMVLSPTGELSGFAGFEDLPEIVIPGQDASLGELQYTNELRGLFPRLPESAGGLDLVLDLGGSGTETLYFAWKKGMLFRSESRSIAEGSADNEDMGFSAQMNHQIESTTNVSFD